MTTNRKAVDENMLVECLMSWYHSSPRELPCTTQNALFTGTRATGGVSGTPRQLTSFTIEPGLYY